MSTRRRPLYVSGRRRTLAFAVVVAASVVTPLAVTGADHLTDSGDDITATAGGAAPTGQTEVALASAPDAVGVDTDIAGGDDPIKEVTSEDPFSMVGVTWKGFNPQASADVRAKQEDGSWGPWYEADAVDGKGDSTTGTGGTEPIFLGTDTTTVQIKLSGVDIEDTSLAGAPDAPGADASTDEGEAATEAATEAAEAATGTAGAAEAAPSGATGTDEDVASVRTSEPAPTAEATPEPADEADSDAASTPETADSVPPVPTRFADIKPVAETSELDVDTLTAVLLSPDDTPTPEPDSFGDIAASGGAGTDADIAARQPSIISRAGWGANESIRCRNASYDNSLAAATVHHTAGSNNYTRESSAGVVRGIYTYHASNLGWCDVGYNVMVDKYGQAFEGRHGGLDRNVQGAHAGGFNGNTWGISMIGDHSTVPPSDATIRKMGEIIGWRLAVAGVDPKGTDMHYSEGTSFTHYARGTAVRLPNIFAHRDVGRTSCPGNAGYAKMGEIRDIAASYAQGGGGNSGGGGGNQSPSTPGTPGDPGSTTPRPGTGGGAQITQGSVQEAAATALRTVLSGGQLDATTLTSILTGGRTLSDIPLDAGSAGEAVRGALGGDTASLREVIGGDFAQLASQLSGPLGRVLSGIQQFGNVSLVKTENGALYSSPETGTHPVWGAIGDAWAAQGFEHGPMGLPTATEAERDDGSVAQEFVGGTLVFDPATGELSIEPTP